MCYKFLIISLLDQSTQSLVRYLTYKLSHTRDVPLVGLWNYRNCVDSSFFEISSSRHIPARYVFEAESEVKFAFMSYKHDCSNFLQLLFTPSS